MSSPAPKPYLRLAALVSSVALAGLYVGYRAGEASGRATPSTVPAAPQDPPKFADIELPVIVPQPSGEVIEIMGGSKSMIGVVRPDDVAPAPTPAPAPAQKAATPAPR